MATPAFRPPAVPLVVHDPYLSIWSFDDCLTDGWSRHWTGSTQALCGLARIDGTTWRWAGPAPASCPALEQVECRVEATTTRYRFRGPGIVLTVTFLSPALARDLVALSSPVAFLSWSFEAIDGRPHSVIAYVDITGEWCTDRAEQPVAWGRLRQAGTDTLRMGSQAQQRLNRSGDDLRIDWGHVYLVPPADAVTAMAAADACRGGFAATGRLPVDDDVRQPRPASDAWPVLAAAVEVPADQSRRVVIAYDDQDSLLWMRRPVVSYAHHHLGSFAAVLQHALQQETTWTRNAAEVDAAVRREATARGGSDYADLVALGYRQALGAHKIVCDIDGEPMMFSKENFSNGCIGTVDVLYPASPLLLYLNPALLEASLRPLFAYASLPRWRWQFAPHDLGQYPWANGQVYGGGEASEDNQMPVEESGNLLILATALVKLGGPRGFVSAHLPLLDRWADYLLAKGLDPVHQLCTDDFAGHLAHNTNLAIKAIVALGAYAALLAELAAEGPASVGRPADCPQPGGAPVATAATETLAARSQRLREAARDMAARWAEMADDGPHFRLAFDRPGTWSQKYNLVWDRVLGLGLFPDWVYDREMDFYATRLQRYGLPLDNRSDYTKLDWCVWTASLSRSREEWDRHLQPVWRFAHESPSRVPLSDWYWTTDARQRGFQARSVVGGLFMPLLPGVAAVNAAAD